MSVLHTPGVEGGSLAHKTSNHAQGLSVLNVVPSVFAEVLLSENPRSATGAFWQIKPDPPPGYSIHPVSHTAGRQR